MAIEVKVDTDQWKNLGDKIKAMQDRAKNLEPVLKGRALALDSVIKRSFEDSKDPATGGVWKDLADSTKERRRKNHKTMKPLVDTGALRTSTGARANQGSVFFGVSGAPAKYAGAHQFGTTRAGRGHKTTIPARPFLPVGTSGRPDFGSESSRAGTWLKRTYERVATFITTGKLT